MNIDHVRIETPGRGPKGGQHCGAVTTDIKVTHIPTNITVQVGHLRSQTRNRDAALEILEYAVNKLAPEYNVPDE